MRLDSLGMLALAAMLGWQCQGFAAEDHLPVCASCHDTGAGGAPRMGRSADWAPRLKKGMPRLISSVRHGVPGTLMASDTCEDCSDAEIARLIRRMSATPPSPKR